MNGLEFDNVDISGINLNGAQLLNCKWNKIRVHELHELDGHSNQVQSVCFSPDGTKLASGSSDNSIRLWDVKTGQQKSKLEGHINTVYSVCFSPDGTALASSNSDNSILIWDVKTVQLKQKLNGHDSWVYSVCFSPDGTILAFGSSDNSIHIWDIRTEYQKSKFDGHYGSVSSVCFSPDGTKLASGGYDNSIRLWDVRLEQQKSKFEGHSHYVQSVCFSPDGTTLASGGGDNSIRLWDVRTGQQKSKLNGHYGSAYSVSFSPDGSTLASGSYDNSIGLWDVKTGQKVQPWEKILQFQTPLENKLFFEDVITIQLISQQPILQAQGALIFQRRIYKSFRHRFKKCIQIKRKHYFEKLTRYSIKLNQNANIIMNNINLKYQQYIQIFFSHLIIPHYNLRYCKLCIYFKRPFILQIDLCFKYLFFLLLPHMALENAPFKRVEIKMIQGKHDWLILQNYY